MPLVNRYAGVIQGGLTVTGNTLVIYNENSYPPAQLPFWTGAFISTDITNQVTGYPLGTTRDGALASSSAILNIPSGSEVVFAQLCWLRTSATDASSAITFRTPGRTQNISHQLSDDSVSNYRWRAADVTAIVNADGGGTYTFGNIPVYSAPDGTNAISSHWTLIVVYENKAMSHKYININTGCANVTGTSQLDYTFTGFSTPLTGTVRAYFMLTATNGDFGDGAQIRVGDTIPNIQVGNASSPWNGVSPYSRINNMIPANILNADPADPNIGMLDTRGSFGTYNSDPYNETVVPFGRVLYDLLGLDISNALSNGQTQLRTNVTFGGVAGAGAGVCTQAVQVQLNSANLGGNLTQTVDKAIADRGDELTYTITFTNTGNDSAYNVLFMDTTPNGTVFIRNSLIIDGVISSRTNVGPTSPINIGTILPNYNHTISFKVSITTIPTTFQITNVGSLSYEFSMGAGLATIVDTRNTNTLTTQINNASLSISKYVNKNIAIIGEVLTYTISVMNIGNVDANNVIFRDTIPRGSRFQINSLRLDGIPQGGVNPQDGITLGMMATGESVQIQFQVVVITIPDPTVPSMVTAFTPITNQSLISYSYIIDPSNPTSKNEGNLSNIVSTNVSYGALSSIIKTRNKAGTDVGSEITYTISSMNVGNTILDNLIIKDTIPNGTTFVAGSILLNGASYSGNPQSGIYVGTLQIGSPFTITFKVSVDTVPSPNPIPNQVSANYNFIVDPSILSRKSVDELSNYVYTMVNTVNVTLTKSSSPVFLQFGETITYEVVINNSGSVSADNVLFRDTIPNGTTFIGNSVLVNGTGYAGNPQSGILIGSVASRSVTTVTFQARVDTIPSPNTIKNKSYISYSYILDMESNVSIPSSSVSNEITNYVVNGQLSPLTKRRDKAGTDVGSEITYTINGSNTGNAALRNVVISDTLPNGTTFVSGSILLNGNYYAGNPQSGINVGTLNVGDPFTVTFKTRVDTVPSPNPIPNQGRINYNFVINPYTPTSQNIEGLSNYVYTRVETVNVTSIKRARPSFLKFGEIITYEVVLNNLGTVTANNVFLIDTIPNEVTFINSSVLVNGVSNGGNPQSGISIGQIGINGVVTVLFQVRVNTIPSPNTIKNRAYTSYSYILDVESGVSSPASILSNEVTNYVVNGDLSPLIKTRDKAGTDVGSEITYTINGVNIGNTRLNNLVVRDTIPNGTTLIPGSVLVNGISDLGNPQTGINIGTLQVGNPFTVIFKVRVDTVPTPNPIPNQGRVNYNFIIDPSLPRTETVDELSNYVYTIVNTVNVTSTKTNTPAYTTLYEIITYEVVLNNLGTVNADNVLVKDTIPNGTTFISNSVLVNGMANGGNPQNGILIGQIGINGVATVSFKVTVDTIPSPNTIKNQSVTSYSYILDMESSVSRTAYSLSNEVTNYVINGQLSPLIKTRDKGGTDVGSEITYTLNSRNIGNIILNNIVLKDTLPNGTSFVSGSILLNGSVYGGDPQSGINVGTLQVGDTFTVTFKALVNTVPLQNPIPNQGRVSYDFLVNPSTRSKEELSNYVYTRVETVNVTSTKVATPVYISVGEIVTYEVVLNNLGTINANDVFFIDTIPSGTTFIENSVLVNKMANRENPQSGIAIGEIASKAVVTVTFKARVDTVPSPNTIKNQSYTTYSYILDMESGVSSPGYSLSNESTNYVVNAELSPLNKTGNKSGTDVGSEITYTINASNIGNVILNNVVIKDTIPSGTIFIPGSVLVNGNIDTGNPQTGINVGTLQIGDTFTLTFKVRVDIIPDTNPIPNQGNIKYDYILDPATQSRRSKEELSNYVYTMVNTAYIIATKKSKPVYTKVLDVITYEVLLNNVGTVIAEDLLFLDTIPNGTTFVETSVLVNGMVYGGNPQTGILIGAVESKTITTLTFKVIVDTIPSPNIIKNQSYTAYSYVPDMDTMESVLRYSLSNEVTNYVVSGDIEVLKSVDKTYAAINEIVTYTLSVTNTGNIPLNNVIIQDTIPAGATFVPRSVYVNGMLQLGANLNYGVGVGSLGILATSQVVFKVRVDTIAQLINNFDARAEFFLDPSYENISTIRKTSNDVKTEIRAAIIGDGPNSFSKVPDKNFVDLGDTITYSVFLENKGNIPGDNIILKDNIPDGTVFIDNSVKINGAEQLGFNPENGILLGTINPNDSVTITFQVVVIVVPIENIIINQATLSYTYTKYQKDQGILSNGYREYQKDQGVLGYSYTKHPNEEDLLSYSNAQYEENLDCEYVTGSSTETVIRVNHGEILLPIGEEKCGFRKTADKLQTERGEIITYCFNIPNSGNIPVNNVIFKDTIPEGAVFIKDSLILDGGVLIGENPENGIFVGTIKQGEVSNISFKVRVETIPDTSFVENIANVNYRYIVDPYKAEVEASSNSNTVLVKILDAKIDNIDGGFIKYVSHDMAEVGDILTYSLRLKNTGNVDAIDVLIMDTIPPGSIFVKGSCSINGVSRPTLDPSRGISIVTIMPNEVITVTFNTLVKSIPRGNLLKNNASISYEYRSSKCKPPISGHGSSNEVITEVRSVNFSENNFVKVASKKYGTIGDIVTYTITINNKGNINAENVWLFDTIANGSVFIDNSIELNGLCYFEENPETGIYIGTITPNTPQTIGFKVRIESIPLENRISNTGILVYESKVDNTCDLKRKESLSNTTIIIVKSPNISIVKSASVSAAIVGEVVTYKFVITNTGNLVVDNFILCDRIPSELEFIQGSITINGASETYADIIAGMELGFIYPNTTIEVEFKAIVVEIPPQGIITNRAIGFYSFIIDQRIGLERGEVVSNNCIITIEVASLSIRKIANRDLVILCDTITYTVEALNNGTITLTDVVIIDKFPSELMFVKNSLRVNGIPINSVAMKDGINIGTLRPYEKAIIKYGGVISHGCGSCLIENEAYGTYNFRSSPNVEEKSGASETSSLIVKGASGKFKEICLDGILCIPRVKVGIQEVDSVEAEVHILNYHIVKTIKAVSEENKKLTGTMVIVTGVLRESVEYTACDVVESIHSAQFERKFSSSIVLPEGYEDDANISVSGMVTDVYYNKLNDREVFSNSTILLEANNIF